jgi:formylglycine-generating enzyme required for sulfatase activity
MKSLCSSLIACSILAASSVASGQATPCKADLDGDGEVSGGDISMLLVKWGGCSGVGCAGDLDSDGEISGGDLSMMLVSWGSCAGPSWATVLEWAPDPTVVYDANLRADIVTTHLPWRVRDNGTGIEMVLIPPGIFRMGCSPSYTFAQWGCDGSESPHHWVTLSRPLYLGRTELAQSDWTRALGQNPSFFAGDSRRPVETVSKNDAVAFCSLFGFRLPTEAEWEYACRAGTTTAIHGNTISPAGSNDGRDLEAIAWFVGNSGLQTHPVGTKAANGFGLFDMLGNVYEWVQDCWIGLGYYPSTPQVDPVTSCPADGPVMRGGSWGEDFMCRSSSRNRFFFATQLNQHVGLRVARDP